MTQIRGDFMYSVLLVDDEEVICRGLKSMLERIGHVDIDEIYTAYDGDKALDEMREKKPDIIITDIRMPVYSGLDIIRAASEQAIDSKFIVLSGYDDFEYVKEAFKLGVQDYLLKPAGMEELKDVLEKVIANIKEEHQQKLSQEHRKSRFLHAVLENSLNKIFSGGLQPEEGVKKLFHELGITLKKPCFSVGIISPVYASSDGEAGRIVLQNIDDIGSILSDKDDMDILYFFDYRNDIVMVFNIGPLVDHEKLSACMIKMSERIKKNTPMECFMSLGGIEKDVEKLPKCYEQAREALEYRLIYNPYEVIRYPSLKAKNSSMGNMENLLQKLDSYIRDQNSVEISNLIDGIFSREHLKNYNMESIRLLYRSIVRRITDMAENRNLRMFAEIRGDISEFHSLSDIRIYLKAVIHDAIAHIKEKNRGKSPVDLVKKFVRENFNKDIDMAIAANMVSMSYTYFSKLFKDETGMNYTDYLIKTRMEKALELLNNPVYRIHDIAVSVGYGNPKHFTRAFKNYFGISPSEYRDSLSSQSGN